MNFLSTGVKEITRWLRRQRNRRALVYARRSLDRADAALGRHAWRELVGHENADIRDAFSTLHRFNDEVESAHLRIAELETEVRAQESARESARRDLTQALAALDEEREPFQRRLAALQTALAEHSRVLHEQNVRKNTLNAAQTAILRRERRARRQGLLLSEEERAARQGALDDERSALAQEAARLAASRSEAVEPMVADETAIREVKGSLGTLDARAQKARADHAARDRAAALAIAGLHKEIAATRRQAARSEEEKEAAFLAIGRHLAGREAAPRGADEPFAATRQQRQHYDRLLGLEAYWHQESRDANRQDLRIFWFVNVTVAIIAAIVLLLVFRTPGKRDWLPANTVTVFALDVRNFTDADFTRALESQEPETWQAVWTGLIHTVAAVPQIDVRRHVARITRALAPADAHGPAVDCLLVRMRSSVDVDSLVREQLGGKDGGFRPQNVDGLTMYQKPGGLAVAQIGPDTLALGSRESVEELIRVRLGLREDLKSDAQFLSGFQRLDDSSAFRLVTYRPRELTFVTDTLLDPQLLDNCTAVGLTLDMREPVSAVFILSASDAPTAGQVARTLEANPDQVLRLHSTGPNLFIAPPEVTRVRESQVEWRFRMTAPAAREFLERVSRLEMGPAGGDGKVAERAK